MLTKPPPHLHTRPLACLFRSFDLFRVLFTHFSALCIHLLPRTLNYSLPCWLVCITSIDTYLLACPQAFLSSGLLTYLLFFISHFLTCILFLFSCLLPCLLTYFISYLFSRLLTSVRACFFLYYVLLFFLSSKAYLLPDVLSCVFNSALPC